MKQKEFYKGLLEVLLLFFVIIVFFFKYYITYNEMDVLPYARALYNESWLKGDWYLNLKIPYRYLFSYPAGALMEWAGFSVGIIIGRLLTYVLMAIALYNLLKSLRAFKSRILLYLGLIIFFKYFPFGNGAGEWMIGGFETKAFAYVFVLLSIASLIRKKMQFALAFAGLALSFHLLIGFYNVLCLLSILVFSIKKDKSLFKKTLLNIPFFILFGAVGIYGIIYQLFLSESLGTGLGWDIYVNKRVSSHTLPSSFPIEMWIKIFVFILLNIWIYIKSTLDELRMSSLYALSTAFLSVLGLIVFLGANDNSLMKYYFFRSADIMLPFLSIVNLVVFLAHRYSDGFLSKKIVRFGLAFLILIITIPQLTKLISTVGKLPGSIVEKRAFDLNMATWIKNNTPVNDVFIVSPKRQFFYINYDRPVFVSWKHAPQNEADLEEWEKRLRLVNGGRGFENKEDLVRGYAKMNVRSIRRIIVEYPEVKHVLVPNSIYLDLKVEHRTAKSTLYSLKEIFSE